MHYFVGGATKLYGAALYRLRPQDFGELKHVDGLSPAWPVGYDDFEPYYTKAEWLYQVHGNHGEDPTEGTGASSTRGPRSRTSRASSSSPTTWRRRGYHPFHAPCGILYDEADRPKSTCIRCTWCDGYPCLVHAKSDAETIAVRPILDHAERDAARRRRGHQARDRRLGSHGHQRRRHPRRQARRRTRPTSWWSRPGASNSAKILLRSANDKHPNGLANGSDQVGRNYMFHNSKAVVALSKERNDTTFQKTLGLNDFYLGADDYEYPIGNIQMVGKSNAEAMKGEEPKLTKLAPHWSLADVAAARGRLLAHHRGPADAREPRDARRPTATCSSRTQATNDDEADRLYHELKKILNHIGLAEHHVLDKNFYMNMNIPVAGCAHQAGTVPLRERPGDVGARRELPAPTRSTTCTSSTRASSRASAR